MIRLPPDDGSQPKTQDTKPEPPKLKRNPGDTPRSTASRQAINQIGTEVGTSDEFAKIKLF
jgi:hypothetical protein